MSESVNQQISVSQVYDRGCEMLRHYSDTLRQVRLTTVVQGIVILTGTLVLAKDGATIYAVIACSFGVLFTFILWKLNWNYLRYFESIQERLIQIELDHFE